MIRTPENTSKSTVVGIPPAGFKDRVILRGKKAQFKISRRSRNPMIEWECEIVWPQTVKGIDGNMYDLTSIPIRYWLVLVEDNGSMDFIINKLMPKLGLDPRLDDENPDTKQFEGLVFDAVISTNEDVQQRRDPDDPEKYIPILDGNGQQIKTVTINAQTRDILGLATLPEEVPAF